MSDDSHLEAASKPTWCVLCQRAVSLTKHTVLRKEGHTYQLYECGECKGQFWTPFLNPGASWYEHDERYSDRNHDPILAPNEKHIGVTRYFGRNLFKVLDVGCGVGNFLAHARSVGWKGWGIDFDKDAISAGRQTFGLDCMEVSDLASFASSHPELRFDLVTAFDVFEHLDDHREFINNVRKVLVPNGFLALSMPYRHGWRWLIPHDLPPRHLTRWDEESVRNFLRREGFAVVHLKRVPASLYFIALKIKSNYGRWSSLGLVRKMKEKGDSDIKGHVDSQEKKVRFIHKLAKAKDMFLFGIPAMVVWMCLLPTRKRYSNFYVIAGIESNSSISF